MNTELESSPFASALLDGLLTTDPTGAARQSSGSEADPNAQTIPEELLPELVEVDVVSNAPAGTSVLGPLHGQTTANDRYRSGKGRLQKEKPIHRQMALMWVKGATFQEIATATGYSRCQISAVLRESFMIELCARMMESGGVLDDVAKLLELNEKSSLLALIQLRDTTKNEALKAKICDSLLDRSRGKATIHIAQEKAAKVTDPKAYANNLLDEIKSLEERLKGPLTGGSNKN